MTADPMLVALTAEMMACHARIHGMIAHNDAVKAVGGNNFYGESAFHEEARTLEHIAQAARNR